MKTKLVLFASALFLSATTFAVSPDKVDFSKIQLNDLHVIDVQTSEDSLSYKFKPLTNPTAAVVSALEEASYSKIVSPLYELNQKSSFKNIYLYIGATAEGTYEFVEVYHNSRDSLSVVDMKITNVEKSYLEVEHGPTYELRHYKISSGAGDLFP